MAIRAFIAIDTPAPIREAMADVQSTLKASDADVNWEAKEKLHATIKFLGSVEESMLPSVVQTIEKTLHNVHPFDITYIPLGSFPSVSRPRVIWIGCDNPDGRLASIKHSLDLALESLGFEKEEREFHPHVTLGRVKSLRNIHGLTSLLQTVTFVPHSSTCEKIILMKSVLKHQGSEYAVIHRFPLS